jgi:hypothetical protein
MPGFRRDTTTEQRAGSHALRGEHDAVLCMLVLGHRLWMTSMQ